VTIKSVKFLVLFGFFVGLYCILNLPFTGPFRIKFWVLGFVAWVAVVISLVQPALKGLGELR